MVARGYDQQDQEVSGASVRGHWRLGLEDARRNVVHRDWLDQPPENAGVVVRDVHCDDAT